MRKIVEWTVKNHVTANLLLVFILSYGFINMKNSNVEVFPYYSLDMISITVPYRGATPKDVEESVCARIEEEIAGIDGIKEIKSTASEGIGTVIVEIQKGYDSRKLLDEIKNAVDRITNFPQEIDKPIITEVSRRTEVLKILVYGDANEKDIKRIAEKIRDDLTSLKEISLVQISASRPYEISINVPRESLEKYNLSLSDISKIVRANCIDIPAGRIKTKDSEILVRTKGLKYTSKDFANIPIINNINGNIVRLKDIATIVDGFEDVDSKVELDGKLTAVINVYRIGKQSALTIEKTVKKYLKEEEKYLPEGVHTVILGNMADILRSRLNLLLRNAAQGLVLVLIMLAMFLEIRLALWVAAGIPVSFLGAFIILPHFGISVNMISLFAFIVCLGMVVDDAIVIGEHIFYKIERGVPKMKASIEGTMEMALPVFLSVSTTIAAFYPLLNVEGIFGKFMFAIPAVVISVLTISLLEALFILPSHLAWIKDRESKLYNILPKYFNKKLDYFIENYYLKLLRKALDYKYITLSIGFFMLLFTLGFFASGHLKFLFFPKVDSDQVVCAIKLPEGASAIETQKAVSYVQKKAFELEREINKKYGKKIIKHIVATIGSQPYSNRHNTSKVTNNFSSNLGEVALELEKSDKRNLDSNIVANMWRRITGEVPGVESISFTSSLFSSGEAINIQLAADDFELLKKLAKELENKLREFKGVYDIKDNLQGGKKELKLKLTDFGKVLGFNVATLGEQVRGAFYGLESVRIQRGKDDVRVMVRFPENERNSKYFLDTLKVKAPDGSMVPLKYVATYKISPSYSVITRANRRRVVNVMADVNEKVADADKILNKLKKGYLRKLKENYPGLSYSFEGQNKEKRDSMKSMIEGFWIAILLIYILLAIPFNSFRIPIVIMTAIPFGIIGAVWGHVLLGYDLSLLSFFGIVALTGVLVNDSLVLIDAIYQFKKEKPELSKYELAIEACKKRFRPVILTSITTFGGLMPLIFEKSVQAKFLIPMALSLGFGVLFATGITLILIPSLYLIFED
ncbi:RND family efflux pump inner membrane protein [Thermotomaculum hydrothermale]|uniref:RND family efflux pump inner membrane protein n=1 Tax=Thermotomaculum hydrothermale TaxID=981385 RepID=A0A7R6PGL1_9BACT|nr:efflux RND transporter permease subunit [Thermotomaculum hydrothermale]BBB32229.1 RND family efflux pump inner membrane protein [Thermotomaculum hydrothermale]